VRTLAGRSRSAPEREPTIVDRGVNVVHAPLYYLAAAAVDWSLGDASPFTRITAMRWLSSALGVLAVYCAWLLAAQLFRREWLQLTVGALVALQPMVAFLSGVVSNDIAVTAAFTAAIAMLLFLQRERPAAAQGLWVGGTVAVALLVKSTALALLPVVALAYAGQALAWPRRRRVVARSGALALGVVLAGAGWWYLRSVLEYGSLTGATSDVVLLGAGTGDVGAAFEFGREWVRLTYRTYWWHYLWREAPRESLLFLAPAVIAALTALGTMAALGRRGRALAAPARPLARQVLVMVAAFLAVALPPLAADILRAVNGEGFLLVAGRFQLPAHACLAALLVLAVRELAPARVLPWACGALVAGAAAFCWTVYWDTYVHRYFGDAPVQELFRRMSFDRPEFVTPVTYTLALTALAGCLVAAVAVVLAGTRRTRPVRRRSAEPAVGSQAP
jgi:4-amino-4-deoxy-L-arabinose transferase-like glycosyltransferase